MDRSGNDLKMDRDECHMSAISVENQFIISLNRRPGTSQGALKTKEAMQNLRPRYIIFSGIAQLLPMLFQMAEI
jgi:hypothetical protein